MHRAAVSLILVLCVALSSVCQESGSFWWKNRDVMNHASNSRSLREQSAKIRTLPPRYRHEDSASSTTVRGIFESHEDESEKDESQFKYDNEPDCVCVAKRLCSENNTIITDGNGLIDERSFNLCGNDNVCCRVPKTTRAPPLSQKVSTTTTQRSILNFDLTNLTDIISTILRPVNSTSFKPPQKPPQQAERKCVSKKGKKLQERILIDDDHEGEGDDDEVVGETSFAEYPWMIELLKRNVKTRNFEYKCGAVLINPTTALTANHCLKNKVPSNYLIRAGEWDRSSTLEYLPHQDRSVAQIISHPQYYSGGLFNDLAILKWAHPLQLDLNVQPICLPEENQTIREGTKCIVTAWGKTSETSPTTDKLKFVKVPIVEKSKCQTQLQNYRLGSRFKLHESFICAGGEEGLDSCQNDGGSPMICKRENDDSYFLIGLVSWGLDCGVKGLPGVYTNIPNLMRWIKSHTAEK